MKEGILAQPVCAVGMGRKLCEGPKSWRTWGAAADRGASWLLSACADGAAWRRPLSRECGISDATAAPLRCRATAAENGLTHYITFALASTSKFSQDGVAPSDTFPGEISSKPWSGRLQRLHLLLPAHYFRSPKRLFRPGNLYAGATCASRYLSKEGGFVNVLTAAGGVVDTQQSAS